MLRVATVRPERGTSAAPALVGVTTKFPEPELIGVLHDPTAKMQQDACPPWTSHPTRCPLSLRIWACSEPAQMSRQHRAFCPARSARQRSRYPSDR